jgi:SAM-dependent methyltransferase
MHQLARHSETILSEIRNYDAFLDSLRNIADMGCGTGEDIHWWATLETRDDPPKPYNFNCFAIDTNESKLSQVPNLPNIHKYNNNFSAYPIFPVTIDLMWAHDSLQYSHNPLETLKAWNKSMTVNGMLVVSIPQTNGVEYNRYYSRTYEHCFYNYTPTSLIYMLAVNGFDCKDAYLLKRFQDPWIQMAVYKSGIEPMDPATTTWEDLIETDLLHPTVVNSIRKHGHIRQEEIIMPWLDRENYYIDWVPQATVIPPEAETIVTGVFNTTEESVKQQVRQRKKSTVETTLLKPVGIIRPPKERYVK